MVECDLNIPKDCVVEEYKERESLKVRKGSYLLVVNMKMGANYRHKSILTGSADITHDKTGYVETVDQYNHWNNFNPQHAINYLKKYPSLLEEMKVDQLSIKKIAEDFMQIGSWFNGCTGIIQQYYHKPCVLSYAYNQYIGVVYFKTARKYKAMIIFNTPRICGIKIMREVTLEKAAELYHEITHLKLISKQLSDEDMAAIISLKV